MPVLKRSAFWGIFICLLFAVQAGFAQKISINGRVSDAKTALPIEGVSIQMQNSGKAAVTDTKGSFSIQTDTVFAGQTLVFSHLGYEKFSLKLKSGQTEVAVKLTPRNNTLSEVKITASKKVKPAKVRPETVLDFAITQNRLFVLGWETGQKNPSLQLLNLYNDSLLMNCRLPVYAEKLFVDCLENLHLLTENQVYQVLSDSVSLALYPPETKTAFEQHLLPCQATDEKNAYFRQNINKGIIVSFYAVNQQTYETNLFRTVADEMVLVMQQSEGRFQYFRNFEDEGPVSNKLPTYSGPGTNGLTTNNISGSAKLRYEGPTAINLTAAGMAARKTRGIGNNMRFAKQIMFQAPYVPLLKVGKQICLFDHVNGEIGFYQNDSLRRVLPVNYHLQPNWDKQIVIDKAQEKAYILFRKNGLPELKLLNLQTGELVHSYKLDNTFAEKITVHNGLVYFLYRDPAKNSRQFLYKAPLNALQN